MFCDYPEKFFPVTQVDIVHFPEGSIENPDVMIEAPKIVGPVPKIINETLSYLRTNVIKQQITKPSDSEKSIKVFNYPYQAFEEAVVNALYHRDYMEREPVEITIEPTHVDILSYAGPDRSISAEAIKAAKKLKARRYRNRRLGDFLKELGLTEGRATGIPTIQKALKDNGSASAAIETDVDRTYFLMTIPCREGFEGIDDTINDTINDKKEKIKGKNENINENINEKELSLFVLIAQSPNIKRKELLKVPSISRPTMDRILKSLSSDPLNLIEYHGSKKTGGYVLTEKGIAYYDSLNQ